MSAPRESTPEALTPTETQAQTNAGVARATGILALGNVGSRVLGMAREVTLTNLFGASAATDAFFVATIVPRTLYDLLIGGHVNGAIIPVLSEAAAKSDAQGDDSVFWRLVSVLFSLVTAIVAGLVIVLTAGAPAVVALVGTGYDAPTQALAVEMLRLTAPALLFLSLFAVLSGTLYALRAFTIPALAGTVFNGCVVAGTILLTPPLGVIAQVEGVGVTWLMGRPADAIRAAALGWLLGALVQLVMQWLGLRGGRLRLTLNWRHPAIRRIGLLYLPVMFSLILDAFVRLFSYNLASQTGTSSLSYMNWATTLIQFPQGLVATAISVAILPTLARQAAAAGAAAEAMFRDTLGLGLRLAITLMLPAAIGLFVLALPIIALLFQHGAFSAYDSAVTALALRLYLIGLPFAAVDLLLVYAFYARQDTRTPAVIGLISLIVYMIVATALVGRIGVFSLMIADSVKHLLHAGLCAWALRRRLGGLGDQRLAATTLKTVAAAGVMGISAWIALPVLSAWVGVDGSTLREALLVAVSGGFSAVVFVGMATLLRIEELRWFTDRLRRRVGRPDPDPLQ